MFASRVPIIGRNPNLQKRNAGTIRRKGPGYDGDTEEGKRSCRPDKPSFFLFGPFPGSIGSLEQP
jgi:hypothetical protein